MVEDGDLGLGLGVELAIDVDFHVGKSPPWRVGQGFSSPKPLF
jgi:hypothetical protein